MKNAAALLLITATSAAAAVSVSAYGGVAFPVGGMAGADYGYFNWLIADNPSGEHDLVDIRGLTLEGTGAAPCPVAGARATAGLAPWLDAEACAFHGFTRADDAAPKSAIENPETEITGFTAGADFVQPLGPFRAAAGAGGGFYLTAVSLYASGEGRSGFVYSNVYTLEKRVSTAGWGVYAGGALAYPLAGRLAVELAGRYHRVLSGGTYEIAIHERYGYDPYHYSEYVFDTPLYKTYDDQFVELSLALTYELP
jgi:hypothetical protein